MSLAHIWLLCSWILYVVLHSVLAAPGVKRRAQRLLGKSYRHYRLGYTLFAFLSLAALLFFQLQVDSPLLFAQRGWTKFAGWTLSVSGALVMAVCIRKYFVSLSGIRSLLEESSRERLMITGIHRYVRHPLYLGTFMFIWGLFLLFPYLSLLIANGVITVYTCLAIPLEEAKLIDAFGEDYRHYRRQVPPLLPFRGPFKAT